jgi:tetratricopeptide (TPR) repeat protein
VTYLSEVGEKAAARSAYRGASTAFERALVALGHLPESSGTIGQSIDLRNELRVALQPLHDLDRILRHLVPAESLAERLGDPSRLARVLGGLCNTWYTRAEHDRAVALGTRALEIGNALNDVALRIEALIRLGAVHYSLGNYLVAVGFLRPALDLMRGRPESERLGFTGLASVGGNTWLARSLSELGEFRRAEAPAAEGLRVAKAADHPFSLIGAHLTLGLLKLHQGHFGRASAFFRSALELGRTWDILGWMESDGGLACALALQGEHHEAIRALESSSTVVPGSGVGLFLARRAAWLGEAARLCDRPEEASRLAAEALRFARLHKERGDEGWALRLLGDLASDREDFAEAERHYRDALTLAEALGMRPLAAHCHRGLGELSQRVGALDLARGELGVARDLYRDMSMAVWLERADAEFTALG